MVKSLDCADVVRREAHSSEYEEEVGSREGGECCRNVVCYESGEFGVYQYLVSAFDSMSNMVSASHGEHAASFSVGSDRRCRSN